MLNGGFNGGLNWNTAAATNAATVPALANKYIYKIDADGYLTLAYNIPPYNYEHAMYISTAPSGTGAAGTAWPQVCSRPAWWHRWRTARRWPGSGGA
jgi:hypothetical protein